MLKKWQSLHSTLPFIKIKNLSYYIEKEKSRMKDKNELFYENYKKYVSDLINAPTKEKIYISLNDTCSKEIILMSSSFDMLIGWERI